MAQPTSCDGRVGLSEVESGRPEEKTMAKKAAKGGKKKAAKKR
jgi:hypothetical protein